MFVLFGIAEAGVLLGRKTYLIDRVDAKHRTTFVAFTNSAMGVVALLFGGLGLIAEFAGLPVLIGVLIALSTTGGLLSLSLPSVSGDSETMQTPPSPRALGASGRTLRTEGKVPASPIIGDRSFKRELLPIM
jgi:MFS family permease